MIFQFSEEICSFCYMVNSVNDTEMQDELQIFSEIKTLEPLFLVRANSLRFIQVRILTLLSMKLICKTNIKNNLVF